MNKKLHIFWRIMLIILPITTTGAFGILAWKSYQSVYGETHYTETLSRGFQKVYYAYGRVRVRNTQTRKFTTPKLDWISNYTSNDSTAVFCQDGKRGYLDLYTGQIVIPAQYQAAWMFSEGLGAVIKDNKLGFINREGQTVIPFNFPTNPIPQEGVDYVFKKGLCTVTNANMKYGIINRKGEWVVQPEYDYISNPEYCYRKVLLNGKYGLLDQQLQWKFPLIYGGITPLKDGFLLFENGIQRKVALDGVTVIFPMVYDECRLLHYNSGKVTDDGSDILLKSDYTVFRIQNKWGLMDKNKLILKAEYDSIGALANDRFYCKISKKWLVLTPEGKLVK